jgi:hypothetical protein
MIATGSPVQSLIDQIRKWIPTEVSVGRLYVIMSTVFLMGIIIFPMHLSERLPYSINPALPISFFVIIGALAMRGIAVLRLCAFDYVMFGWIILTLFSQMTAPATLYRSISEFDVISVQLALYTIWFTFRAFYALTVINPKTAVNTILLWMLIFITCTCVMGILQSVGPVQEQMIDLGYRIGAGQLQIKLGAYESTGVRTTAVFSGPNIYGFVNVIGACIVTGGAIAMGQRLRERHALIAIGLLLLFCYGNLNSQSRSTFLFAAIITVILLLHFIRIKKWRALLMSFALVLAGAILVIGAAQKGQFNYMTSIFETGLQKDGSYQVRMEGMSELAKIANDIPVLGVAQDYFSLNPYGRGDFYSKANGTGDNGIAFFYHVLGIPGLLVLAGIILTTFQAARRLALIEQEAFVSRLRNIAFFVWTLYVVSLPLALRYPKFETASFYMMTFAPVFAVIAIAAQKARREAILHFKDGQPLLD